MPNAMLIIPKLDLLGRVVWKVIDVALDNYSTGEVRLTTAPADEVMRIRVQPGIRDSSIS